MTSFSTLSLYALTVKQPSATQDAISGDFTGNGEQQILTANGSRLALLQVSRRQKGFTELYSQNLFGIIRRIAKFRLAGASKGMFSLFETQKPFSDFRRHADSCDLVFGNRDRWQAGFTWKHVLNKLT
jgi:hypothetical protein